MTTPAMERKRRKRKPPAERKVTIRNEAGLHLRAAGRFVDMASRFQSKISVKVGTRTVGGKSIIDMLTLGATMGTEMTIGAEGPDADEALDRLEALVARNFTDDRQKN